MKIPPIISHKKLSNIPKIDSENFATDILSASVYRHSDFRRKHLSNRNLSPVGPEDTLPDDLDAKDLMYFDFDTIEGPFGSYTLAIDDIFNVLEDNEIYFMRDKSFEAWKVEMDDLFAILYGFFSGLAYGTSFARESINSLFDPENPKTNNNAIYVPFTDTFNINVPETTEIQPLTIEGADNSNELNQITINFPPSMALAFLGLYNNEDYSISDFIVMGTKLGAYLTAQSIAHFDDRPALNQIRSDAGMSVIQFLLKNYAI